MKKILFPAILLFCFSCSNVDENQMEIANITTLKVENLKEYFDHSVMGTPVYDTYKRNLNLMLRNIDVAAGMPDFETREGFSNWIKNNIERTSFVNLDEALRLYDDLVRSANDFVKKHEAFLKNIKDMTPSEFSYIFEEELGAANIPLQTTPCQDGCIDQVNKDLDNAEAILQGAAAELEYNGNGLAYFIAQWRYERALNSAIHEFNDCMGGCK